MPRVVRLDAQLSLESVGCSHIAPNWLFAALAGPGLRVALPGSIAITMNPSSCRCRAWARADRVWLPAL
jgi:hypothetical protein